MMVSPVSAGVTAGRARPFKVPVTSEVHLTAQFGLSAQSQALHLCAVGTRGRSQSPRP